MDRETIIEILIQDDLEFVQNSPDAAREMFATIMADGFPGYVNFTDSELDEELNERGLV